MLREHVINFLEAAVVLLLLTNAVSTMMAVYAISIARGVIRPGLRLSEQPALVKVFAGSARR
jgi:stage V sporulation protein SpoVS